MATGGNKVLSALQMIRKCVNSTGRDRSLHYVPLMNEICRLVGSISKEDVNFNDETMSEINAQSESYCPCPPNLCIKI